MGDSGTCVLVGHVHAASLMEKFRVKLARTARLTAELEIEAESAETVKETVGRLFNERKPYFGVVRLLNEVPQVESESPWQIVSAQPMSNDTGADEVIPEKPRWLRRRSLQGMQLPWSRHKLTVADLQQRVPLYHPDFPFIVLWSQKAACTTIVRWLFLQLGILTNEMCRSLIETHQYEHRIFKRRAGYRHEMLRAIRKGIPVIKFVRDPYARAYSIYVECCSAPHHAETHWGERARTMFWHDTTGADNKNGAFSFRQFLEWLSTKKMDEMNLHLRPQYLPRDDLLNLRLCRIERLSDSFAELEKEFCLPKLSAEHPAIFDSGHHRKKANLTRAEALASLEQGVPRDRPKDFCYANVTRDLVAGNDIGELVRRSYGIDVEKYYPE